MIKAINRYIAAIAGFVLISTTVFYAFGQLLPGDLVAICGDSITEQKDYSAVIQAYLLACQPAENLNSVQFGWSGETAGGFVKRFDADVVPFKPMVATTCYGMNDGGYRAVNEATVNNYRANMVKIVNLMKEAGIRTIVVGSPGIVDPVSYRRGSSSAEEYNETLRALADAAKEVAESEGVIFADVYEAMMTALNNAQAEYGENYALAGDGVHPRSNGHLPMAYAFLKALGCDGNIGKITFDFATGKAECDTEQKILDVKDGVIQIESVRYPFYLDGAPKNDSRWGIAQCMPFNEDLNRYLLIIDNAPARAKITWGVASREYEKAELEAGVNLAADFIDHPFKAPFERVMAAVRAQQAYETTAIKNLLRSLRSLSSQFPENGEEVKTLESSIFKKADMLRQKSRDEVVPVQHSIIIEEL
jgi:lysophospholipase L1-like esterase